MPWFVPFSLGEFLVEGPLLGPEGVCRSRSRGNVLADN